MLWYRWLNISPGICRSGTLVVLKDQFGIQPCMNICNTYRIEWQLSKRQSRKEKSAHAMYINAWHCMSSRSTERKRKIFIGAVLLCKPTWGDVMKESFVYKDLQAVGIAAVLVFGVSSQASASSTFTVDPNAAFGGGGRISPRSLPGGFHHRQLVNACETGYRWSFSSRHHCKRRRMGQFLILRR